MTKTTIPYHGFNSQQGKNSICTNKRKIISHKIQLNIFHNAGYICNKQTKIPSHTSASFTIDGGGRMQRKKHPKHKSIVQMDHVSAVKMKTH